MEEGNYHKFTKCQKSKQMVKALLDTGDRELVEVSKVCENESLKMQKLSSLQASPTDRIWGVGFAAANAEANRESWGENRLGKAIMNVRERLRKESS